MENKKLFELAKKFKVSGEPTDIKLIDSGHINKTYKVVFEEENKKDTYILQYVNTNVFPNLPELMNNIKKVTSYIKNKATECNEDISRITITMKDTVDDNPYAICENNWRMEDFIDNTTTYLSTEDLNILYEAGKSVGTFQRYLDGFPADELYEIIPKFHYTPNRLNQLMDAINNEENKKIRQERFEKAKEAIEFLTNKNRTSKAGAITSKLGSKEVPLRVTHNDTKLSNILFDKNTNKAVALIDLDTVMPGAIAYDFGEAIRTGIVTSKEDEQDLSKIYVDINRFEAFTKGFLEKTKSILTKEELEMLPLGAWMMTYENSMRFVADYLNGDTYFHVDENIPDHNLVRAKAQIEIIRQMEEKQEEMEGMIKKYGL